jgi:hypothetical protein
MRLTERVGGAGARTRADPGLATTWWTVLILRCVLTTNSLLTNFCFHPPIFRHFSQPALSIRDFPYQLKTAFTVRLRKLLLRGF